MRYPWANTILLYLLIIQFATGFVGLISGAESFSWVLWLHGVGRVDETSHLWQPPVPLQ